MRVFLGQLSSGAVTKNCQIRGAAYQGGTCAALGRGPLTLPRTNERRSADRRATSLSSILGSVPQQSWQRRRQLETHSQARQATPPPPCLQLRANARLFVGLACTAV